MYLSQAKTQKLTIELISTATATESKQQISPAKDAAELQSQVWDLFCCDNITYLIMLFFSLKEHLFMNNFIWTFVILFYGFHLFHIL